MNKLNILSTCLVFIYPTRIFSVMNMRKKIPRKQDLWTWCQRVVPNDVPRDFGPVIAFWVSQGENIPVSRQ